MISPFCGEGGGQRACLSLSSATTLGFFSSSANPLPSRFPQFSCHSLFATDDDKTKLIENFGYSKYICMSYSICDVVFASNYIFSFDIIIPDISRIEILIISHIRSNPKMLVYSCPRSNPNHFQKVHIARLWPPPPYTLNE